MATSVATDIIATGKPGGPVTAANGQPVFTITGGVTSTFTYDGTSQAPGAAYDVVGAATKSIASVSSASVLAAASSAASLSATETQPKTSDSASTTTKTPSAGSTLETPGSSQTQQTQQTVDDGSSLVNTSTTSSQPSVSPSKSGTKQGATTSKGSSQQTQAPAPTPGQNNIGLKAGVGVLAALLALALIAIAFLLFRRRRQRGRAAHAPPQSYSNASDADPNNTNGFSDKPYAAVGGAGASRNGPVANLPASLDDRTVNSKFSQLDSAIQDFVASSFRNGTPANAAGVDANVAALLGKISPEWPTLLAHDQRSRFILLRGLVAHVLSSAYTNGELLGDTEVSQLNSRLSNGAHSAPASHWRAKTLSLLSSSPQRLETGQVAIDRIVKYIDAATTDVVRVPSTNPSDRLRRLQQLVTTTSDLAFELALQNVDFEWSWGARRSTTFEKGEMEDVLQEKNEREMSGRQIKAFVFPGVRRWGSEEDGGWDQARGIKKGMVLI